MLLFNVYGFSLATKIRRSKQTKKRNQDPKNKLNHFIYQRRYKTEWFTKKHGQRPLLLNKYPDFKKIFFLFLTPTLLKRLKAEFIHDIVNRICQKTVGKDIQCFLYEHKLGSKISSKMIKIWIDESTTSLSIKFPASEYEAEHKVWQHLVRRTNIFVHSCGVAYDHWIGNNSKNSVNSKVKECNQ